MKDTLPNDDILISRLLDMDENTYKQVVNHYHRIMYIVASSIVGDAIADEVVQDAWVAVIRSLGKFEKRSSFKTWLLTIVSNCAKSRIRKESRKVSCAEPHQYAMHVSQTEQFSSPASWHKSCDWHYDTPAEILAKDQLKTCIHDSINSLPALQKAVLTLINIQGLDTLVVCKMLDISYPNSRVLLHRARKHVHERITQFQESAEIQQLSRNNYQLAYA